MKKLNSSDNTVGALLNEKELYNEAMGKIESLDGVIENVNLLLEDMKANPGRYIHFSVFGKKDKK
jgi:phospholipid/cholesterol/gamma-HCH transport system substrate-binding protein